MIHTYRHTRTLIPVTIKQKDKTLGSLSIRRISDANSDAHLAKRAKKEWYVSESGNLLIVRRRFRIEELDSTYRTRLFSDRGESEIS